MALPVFAGQWQQGAGGWWYQRDDGSYPANAWEMIDGDYYHFDANGYMQTGWYYEVDKTLSSDWTVNACYYLDPASGKMLKNTIVRDFSPTYGTQFDYEIEGDGNCLDKVEEIREQLEDENFNYVTENTDYMGMWWSGEWQRRYGTGSNDISDDELEYQMTYDEDDVLEQQMTYDEDDVLEWQTWGDQGFDY